mmetsp:Transcript_21863/g.44926  ORF Transcript_21863/g.44926 Transcript_21863/m.44926 type:complete len:166 (-) Transcript_21863:469-966(-)
MFEDADGAVVVGPLGKDATEACAAAAAAASAAGFELEVSLSGCPRWKQCPQSGSIVTRSPTAISSMQIVQVCAVSSSAEMSALEERLGFTTEDDDDDDEDENAVDADRSVMPSSLKDPPKKREMGTRVTGVGGSGDDDPGGGGAAVVLLMVLVLLLQVPVETKGE